MGDPYTCNPRPGITEATVPDNECPDIYNHLKGGHKVKVVVVVLRHYRFFIAIPMHEKFMSKDGLSLLIHV